MGMKLLALSALLSLAAVAALAPYGQTRKRKQRDEPATQVLELPKELPVAVTAETRRLSFRVTPLSARGLLSQQVRDALRWLLREERGAAVVKLRAFVAGSGDLRRVQILVSEMFSEKRLRLPALSLVQAGALPLEGAQVVFEAISEEKRAVHSGGLVFVSAQPVSSPQWSRQAAPLARQSMERLRTALEAAGAGARDALAVTCFLSTLEDVGEVRKLAAGEFPGAVLDFVQPQRELVAGLAGCEAVARLARPASEPLLLLNPPRLPAAAGQSQAAVVGAERLALTGTQLAFGFEEPDARLAFQRLGKALEQAGGAWAGVAVSNLYPLSGAIAGMARKVRSEFPDPAKPPAGATLAFEGLPSLDAAFAVDAIAVLSNSN